MLIECLLGAFLPAMMKDCEIYGGVKNASKVKNFAAGLMFMLLATVLLGGIPTSNFKNYPAFLVSFAFFIVEIITIVVLIFGIPTYGTVVEVQRDFINTLPKVGTRAPNKVSAMLAYSMSSFNPAKLRIT